MAGIGLTGVDTESLLANRHPHAAPEHVPIIVNYLLEWPLVDDRLLVVPADALLAFICSDGNTAELDAFHRAPGFVLPLQDGDTVESRFLKGLQELVFTQRPRDAAAP